MTKDVVTGIGCFIFLLGAFMLCILGVVVCFQMGIAWGLGAMFAMLMLIGALIFAVASVD